MAFQHCSHAHPLLLMEEKSKSKEAFCSACRELITGSSYICSQCEFYLHKSCAELPNEINHPLHLQHPLILDAKLKDVSSKFSCSFCRKGKGFVYRCSSCQFGLDVRCAFIPQLVIGDFSKLQHFSHAHPLIFIENHYIEAEEVSCSGCEEPISGPIYCCFDCEFYLHKKCVELPLQIHHPSHRKHPLVLLASLPPHQEKCSCQLCRKPITGFVYYCSPCMFGIKIKYTFSQRFASESHEHPFTLLAKPIAFICDACGTNGDCNPYTCIECNHVVHKDCISLPHTIKITLHDHPVHHIYFLQENEVKKRNCRICRSKVNVEYGSYYCNDCDCIVHVNCAIDIHYLDKEFELEDENQKHNKNLLSYGFKVIKDAGDDFTREIQHFSHEHNLKLKLNNGEVEGNRCCNGCMLSISNLFYYCDKCDFFLHKSCAELPMKIRYWRTRHPLTLRSYTIFKCDGCLFYSSGFAYYCNECDDDLCLRCYAIPEVLTLRGHEHPFFFNHKCEGKCNACGSERRYPGFRCKDHDFILCYRCVTLPHTAQHKYDGHPLMLLYRDGNHPDQCYCDICEEERDPNHWYYYCTICDFSAHPLCVLGKYPFVKLGSTYRNDAHPHPLTFVQKRYYYPTCNNCGEYCYNLALECTESKCKFTVHLDCISIISLPMPRLLW
ncbi:hypothetical protein SLA2020_328250 [Shorea laevis]